MSEPTKERRVLSRMMPAKRTDEPDVAERMRRVETRVTAWMCWSGFNPHRNLSTDERNPEAPHCYNGAVYVPSPATSIGDIKRAITDAGLIGEVPVRIGGRVWGTITGD